MKAMTFMDRPVFRSILRGIRRRCPRCAQGKLLSGYLAPVVACNNCGEDFSKIRADDGPAWATILVLGHVIVPLMLVLGRDETVPVWLAISVLAVIMAIGVFLVLPRAKGMFIALIWATGATGEDMTTAHLQENRDARDRQDI